MEIHHKMKELPESEKPYERFERFGASSLTDAELLAIILQSGGQKCNALQLAQEILCRGQRSLLNLNSMQVQELTSISGIGKVKAMQLKCIAELSKRIATTTYQWEIQADKPETIAAYYMEQLRHETREILLLAMFNAKNQFLEDAVLSVGTVDSSLVSPREIYLRALGAGAVNIMILHNHPSGDPTPSHEDLRTTLRVAECGRLLGIQLADHIIIGDNSFISLREEGIIN